MGLLFHLQNLYQFGLLSIAYDHFPHLYFPASLHKKCSLEIDTDTEKDIFIHSPSVLHSESLLHHG